MNRISFRLLLKVLSIVGLGILSLPTLKAQEIIDCPEMVGGPELYPTKSQDPPGLYEQNLSPACAFISLLNANILAGADDTNGKFLEALKVCLNKKGFPNAWLGLNNPGAGVPPRGTDGRGVLPTSKAILDCKKEVMANQGKIVSFSSGLIKEEGASNPFVTSGTAQQTANDPCETIRKTLAAGGSTTLSIKKLSGGHGVTVRGISCDHGSPPNATLQLSDPNAPNSNISITVNGSGVVTSSSGEPPGISSYVGADILSYTNENRN